MDRLGQQTPRGPPPYRLVGLNKFARLASPGEEQVVGGDESKARPGEGELGRPSLPPRRPELNEEFAAGLGGLGSGVPLLRRLSLPSRALWEPLQPPRKMSSAGWWVGPASAPPGPGVGGLRSGFAGRVRGRQLRHCGRGRGAFSPLSHSARPLPSPGGRVRLSVRAAVLGRPTPARLALRIGVSPGPLSPGSGRGRAAGSRGAGRGGRPRGR